MKPLTEYENIRDYLADFYHDTKKKYPGFSHRVLAQKVGFSNGYFSRILSGEKKISEALVEKFIAYLKLRGNDAEYFRALVIYSQSPDEAVVNRAFKRMISLQSCDAGILEVDQFELFHTWYHSVIFSLCHMGQVTESSDFEQMGKQLFPTISGKEFEDSLKLLQKLELIDLKNGTYKVQQQFLTTGSKHKNRHIRNYLLNSINQARYALLNTPQPERDITTMTLSISENGYREIQELVQKFRSQVNEIVAADSELDQVCQVNIQQFPLFKSKKESRDDS